MIPPRKEIKEKLVELIQSRGEVTPKIASELLARSFALNESDLAERTNDGKDSKFEKEVRWARKDLVDEGVLQKSSPSSRGIWKLLNDSTIPPVLCDDSTLLMEEARKLFGDKRQPIGQKKPERIDRKSGGYKRDAAIVAAVWRLANGACELCLSPAPFLGKYGEPFLEVHHVKRLANGGSDTMSNAVGLCPNCHRELHYGKDSESKTESLYKQVGRLIRE